MSKHFSLSTKRYLWFLRDAIQDWWGLHLYPTYDTVTIRCFLRFHTVTWTDHLTCIWLHRHVYEYASSSIFRDMANALPIPPQPTQGITAENSSKCLWLSVSVWSRLFPGYGGMWGTCRHSGAGHGINIPRMTVHNRLYLAYQGIPSRMAPQLPTIVNCLLEIVYQLSSLPFLISYHVY